MTGGKVFIWSGKQYDEDKKILSVKSCWDCEYHVGGNRCPLYEKQNHKIDVCEYFSGWQYE